MSTTQAGREAAEELLDPSEEQRRDPTWWRRRADEIDAEIAELAQRHEELELRLRVLRGARSHARSYARYLDDEVGYTNPSFDKEHVLVIYVKPHVESWIRECRANGVSWRIPLAKRANVSTKLLQTLINDPKKRTITFRSYERIMNALGLTHIVSQTPTVDRRRR